MSSTDLYEIDERLYELYVSACRVSGTTPSIKDHLIWLEENDYDKAELWDGGPNDEN